MSSWKGLLDGEYADRKTILGDLTLEQVTRRLSPQSHSIYDELWHTVLWQRILVTRDEALYETTWQKGIRYPDQPAKELEEWTALVASFFITLAQAYDWTSSPEKLSHEVDPGVTMADVIRGLAVHNAYHFGKIVTLRQAMGLWNSQ
ncbi:DinB family protein [Deinococcus sp. UYEF24]